MAGWKETHGWPRSTVVVKRSTTGTRLVACAVELMLVHWMLAEGQRDLAG